MAANRRNLTYCSGAIGLLFVLSTAGPAITIDGNALALKSEGTSNGTSWVLSNNGYVGTYITLTAPTSVTVAVSADGAANPSMDVVIDDTRASYAVATGLHTYSHTYSLPAGTHFVRTQLTNDSGISGRQLTINSLSVAGASVSNINSDANALAASDTYIANFRKGNATVKIAGLSPGQQVNVSLKRIAFNFGGGVKVKDDGSTTILGNGGTTLQQNYQSRFNQNFNTIAANGPGYWEWNEPMQGQPVTAGLHQVYDYAASHGLYSREHNLIWDMSQPDWVDSLKTQAVASQAAKNNLSAAIQNRIGYYIAGGTKFNEIDIYNESYNRGQLGGNNTYWNLYGPTGIAKIYHDAKVAATGYSPKLVVNDYGILQGNSDAFGKNLDSLQQAGVAAGYGPVVDAIGMQYYSSNLNEAQPSNMFYGLQNMNVRGLPTELTEFGTFAETSATDSATILGQAMRLMFGNPSSTGFIVWDWYKATSEIDPICNCAQFAPGAALYDVSASDWSGATLTQAGKAWQDQLGIHDWDGNPNNGWTTQLTATVAADGTISFNGFYGDYEITANGKNYHMSLTKGTTSYALGYALPGDFNLDGIVDAADYLLWRKGRGTIYSPADYMIWRTNFGKAIASGVLSAASVPEPASALLCVLGAAATAQRKARTSR
ncbi:MAG TPA: endo-1,4-beta-xylanase [Lacipirellulaceae bacterium]|nr:endo-1,4-beta-xylanase [Lacipirellulaceae bacterium]